jgi:hypothetical protein
MRSGRGSRDGAGFCGCGRTIIESLLVRPCSLRRGPLSRSCWNSGLGDLRSCVSFSELTVAAISSVDIGQSLSECSVWV